MQRGVNKRWFFACAFLLLVVGVVAYGTSTPSTFGHSAGELEGVCKTDGTGCPAGMGGSGGGTGLNISALYIGPKGCNNIVTNATTCQTLSNFNCGCTGGGCGCQTRFYACDGSMQGGNSASLSCPTIPLSQVVGLVISGGGSGSVAPDYESAWISIPASTTGTLTHSLNTQDFGKFQALFRRPGPTAGTFLYALSEDMIVDSVGFNAGGGSFNYHTSFYASTPTTLAYDVGPHGALYRAFGQYYNDAGVEVKVRLWRQGSSGSTPEPEYVVSCAVGSSGLNFPFCCRMNTLTGVTECKITESLSGGWVGASTPFAPAPSARYSLTCSMGISGLNFPFCCRTNTLTGAVQQCSKSVDTRLTNWQGFPAPF